MENYTAEVRSYIVDNFLFGDDAGLKNDASLLEEGIIDSTGVLELVDYLESAFSISIEDDELIPENLDSIDNIAAFVASKTVAAPSSGSGR